MMIIKENLSRFLIFQKLCSERSVKNFIKNNQVCVNSILIKNATFKVDSGNDIITVNKKILPPVKHIYIMLNKPSGTVCSKTSDSHKTVFELLQNKFSKEEIERLNCVGRLDCNTKGLLLLSTNGTFINELTQPEFVVEKKYFVKLQYCVSKKNQIEYSKKVLQGIKLLPEKKSPSFVTKPAKINWLTDDTLEITVIEGKFHEVKRIFGALENCVVELKRLSMGEFVLDEKLNEGEFKVLE